MADLGQLLEDLGIVNGDILDEVRNLPGCAEIEAGLQLSPEQVFAFRKAIAKTVVIYGEKEAAHVKFCNLMCHQTFKQWIHGFAPFAKDIISTLQPIIKIICYHMNWPYAEVWSQHDTPGSRTLRVAKSFIYPYKCWFSIEPRIEELATFMDSYSIALPSRELPGDVFTSSEKIWGETCFYKTRNMERRMLLSQASLHYTFVVPLNEDKHQNITHALVFYAPVVGPRSRSARKFLFPTAQDAVNIHKTVEVIQADEKEMLDKARARWGNACTRLGGIRSGRIGDRLPKV